MCLVRTVKLWRRSATSLFTFLFSLWLVGLGSLWRYTHTPQERLDWRLWLFRTKMVTHNHTHAHILKHTHTHTNYCAREGFMLTSPHVSLCQTDLHVNRGCATLSGWPTSWRQSDARTDALGWGGYYLILHWLKLLLATSFNRLGLHLIIYFIPLNWRHLLCSLKTCIERKKVHNVSDRIRVYRLTDISLLSFIILSLQLTSQRLSGLKLLLRLQTVLSLRLWSTPPF